MKNQILKWVKFFTSLVFLIVFVVLVWVLFTSLVKVFNDTLSGAETTIVVAVVSAVVSIITIVISKSSDRKMARITETKNTNQSKYDELLKEIIDCTTNSQLQAIDKKYSSFILTHSNDEVLFEFNRYLKTGNFDHSRLVVAIRKELALSKKNNPNIKE